MNFLLASSLPLEVFSVPHTGTHTLVCVSVQRNRLKILFVVSSLNTLVNFPHIINCLQYHLNGMLFLDCICHDLFGSPLLFDIKIISHFWLLVPVLSHCLLHGPGVRGGGVHSFFCIVIFLLC